MNKTEAARATMVGATLSLGVMTLQVDLVSATRSKKNSAADTAKLTNICPTCETPSPLRQQYYCEAEHHGPFAMKDADKAMTEDGTLKRVKVEDVKAVKKEIADNRSIELRVFPSADVEAQTMPSGAVYRLRPQRNTKGPRYAAADVQRYALLVQLVADPERAFIAEVGIKGASSMFRCVAHDGALALVGLTRPEDLVPTELLDMPELPEVSDALTSTGRHMVTEAVETFDPSEWADGIQAGLKELRANTPAAENQPEVPATQPAAKELAKLLKLVA